MLVPRYGIEGKIYLCDGLDPNEFWDLNKTTQAVTSPDKKHTLQVFGRVTVEVSMDESKPHAPKVVFKCLNPPLHQASGTPYTREQAKKLNDKAPTNAPKPDSQVVKDNEENRKRKRSKSNAGNSPKKSKK